MREIPLTLGHIALVDDADFERVNQFKWCALIRYRKDGSILKIYARNSNRSGVLMHRFILGVTDLKTHVDHEDHNGLHNWRTNLRKASRTQNTRYQRKTTLPKSSRYKGASWNKRDGRWSAQIRFQNKLIYLGYFTSEEDAARAYDVKARELFGEFALTNL